MEWSENEPLNTPPPPHSTLLHSLTHHPPPPPTTIVAIEPTITYINVGWTIHPIQLHPPPPLPRLVLIHAPRNSHPPTTNHSEKSTTKNRSAVICCVDFHPSIPPPLLLSTPFTPFPLFFVHFISIRLSLQNSPTSFFSNIPRHNTTQIAAVVQTVKLPPFDVLFCAKGHPSTKNVQKPSAAAAAAVGPSSSSSMKHCN